MGSVANADEAVATLSLPGCGRAVRNTGHVEVDVEIGFHLAKLGQFRGPGHEPNVLVAVGGTDSAAPESFTGQRKAPKSIEGFSAEGS